LVLGKREVNHSTVFAGQNVGVKQVDERIWLVIFMQHDLGFLGDETCRLESAKNPFQANVLPMSPVLTVTHVTGIHLDVSSGPCWVRTSDQRSRRRKRLVQLSFASSTAYGVRAMFTVAVDRSARQG
jgi:hypothetical protein